MKKVLTAALALGLVAGVASTAAAAYDSFSVTGYYEVEGNVATNMDRTNGVDLGSAYNAATGAGVNAEYSSAWYYHKFRAYPVLKVNDKVSLKAELRLLHDDWGAGNNGQAAGADTGDWDKMWLEYDSPLGMLKIGTTAWGAWGTSFGDTGVRNNAIMWTPNMVPAPFNALLFLGKLDEEDSTDTFVTNASSTGNLSDEDSDYYEARFGMKTDTIDTQIGLGMSDNQTAPTVDASTMRLRWYGKMSMAGLNIEAEFDHGFGDTDTDVAGGGTTSVDTDTWAAYAAVNGKAGQLGWGIMGWYVSGDDNAADNNNEAYGGPGNDFSPLLIATGDNFGLLQNDLGANAYYYNLGVNVAGQYAFGAYASMPVSDKLTLTSVIGTAYADEEIRLGANVDDHYGWELDIKASYKLLDNLTYSLNLGYFDAGDAFDDIHVANVNSQDDVILVNHTLNMKF